MSADEELVELLARVANAFVAGRAKEAAKLMDSIRFEPPQAEATPDLRTPQKARVFKRDRFSCRYCGTPTIPPIILRVFSALYPVEFPFDPHWNTRVSHIAYWSVSASVDHVLARSTGGGDDIDNLVTACWSCNQLKSNVPLERLEKQLQEIDEASTWDGLTGVYPQLWEAAGRPQPAAHREWLRALDPSAI
jgi:hypothetical protein